MLSLRFIGISCFVDGREKDPFAKRLILPNDMHAEHRGDGAHIPYIEVDLEDLAPNVALEPSKTFTRGTRTYRRFDLDGERISVTNANRGDGRLTVVPTFEERVPSMILVCPDCPPTPRPECFESAPPRDLVAAYFDIRTGFLSSGPIEDEQTRFDEGSNWPPRRLARWVQLDLAYHGTHAEILLESFDGKSSRVIPVKRDAALVTIGNMKEEDIEERVLVADPDRLGHFDMYYDLGDSRQLPKKRPRPTIQKGALRGCAPSNWP
jgi:hypothetical protein